MIYACVDVYLISYEFLYLQEEAEQRCQAVSLASGMAIHSHTNPGVAVGTDHPLAGCVHQNSGLMVHHVHRRRSRSWDRDNMHLRHWWIQVLLRLRLIMVHLVRRRSGHVIRVSWRRVHSFVVHFRVTLFL